MTLLSILLIEDNEQTLTELADALPKKIGEYNIEWDPCNNFDTANEKIKSRRYDLIVTDIYVDAINSQKQSHSIKDTAAGKAIELLRESRFCAILAITDGSKPEEFPISPFIGYADKTKTKNIVAALTTLIHTGIPRIARRIHDDIDHDVGKYVWTFLEKHWNEISLEDELVIERLVRRRASILMSRVRTDSIPPSENESVEGLEFYLYPTISGDELRLGEVIKNKKSDAFSVVLTPHCHLTVQEGKTEPRATFVLVVNTVKASKVFKQNKFESTNQGKQRAELRKRIQGAPPIGSPAGRYWFLPGFLEIPDLYCDFLKISSIPYDTVFSEYARIAVIDTPFAEALQSSFTSFYSAVGTPNLNVERFWHLFEGGDSQK